MTEARLVVSEALWKGTPVVAGRAGGIPLQLADDAGGLVDSVEECAARSIELLRNPDEAALLATTPPTTSRVRRSKREARAVYDRRSRGYGRWEGRFERAARQTGEAQLEVRPGETVLDVGSGPGESLVAFAKAAGAGGSVVGLDLSPGMHAVATERVRRDAPSGRVQLVLGDGAHMPLRSASCDAVFTSFTLELFDTPELPVVVREMRRVLRPGGRLSIVALDQVEPAPMMMRLYLLAHRLMPRLVDCRPIPVANLVEHAGFQEVSEHRSSIWGIPIAIVGGREPDP